MNHGGSGVVPGIGRVVDAANHHPDVDLRSDGVTVRLTTTTPDYFFWLSERDIELARQISAAARELDVPGDPTAVQSVQVTIDALVHPQVMPFWRAVLGYREVGDEDLPRPPRLRAAVLVPADGRAAPVAQPDSHRRLGAARPGGGARRGGDRRRWPPSQ